MKTACAIPSKTVLLSGVRSLSGSEAILLVIVVDRACDCCKRSAAAVLQIGLMSSRGPVLTVSLSLFHSDDIKTASRGPI